MKKICYSLILFLFPLTAICQNISGVINDYAEVTSINSCTVTVVSSAGFSAGDRVLIIQMKGAEIDTNDVPSFGSILNYNNAGNYEINTIQSVAGPTIILQFQPLRAYTVAHKVQLVRVPVYNNANVTGILTCQAWNGSTGGVLVFIDNGTTTLNADIDVKEKGFAGTTAQSTGWQNCNASYKMHNSTIEALKGESITILPITATKGTGAPSNGGGGGRTDNGGGGGSNFGAGGIGGDRGWTTTCNLPAQGGKPLTYNNALNKVFLGGAGGDAQRSEGPGTNMGVNGAGIVIIKANAITGNNNSIIATGKTAANTAQDGGGGGGAGGSVLLEVPTFNNALNINTSGGKGGDAVLYQSVKCSGGGGGGGGVLWVSTAGVSPNIVHTSNGGALGLSLTPAINAFPGQSGGNVTGLAIPISNLPCLCTIPPTINTLNITSVSCFSGANGGISVSASGAVAPYSYNWFPGGQTTSSVSSLPAGIYTLTVTDDDGCWDSATFVITQPPVISTTVNPVDVLCFGNSDGTATVNVAGGTGPYQYTWSNSQTGNSASGFSTGTFSITITDNNGCTHTNSFVINTPPLLQVNIANINSICVGQSAILSCGPTGGTPGYSYLWDTGINTQTISVSPTATSIYSVTVTDNKGCTAISTQTLTVNDLPAVSFSADTIYGCAPLCVNFILNSPGAVSSQWSFGDAGTSASLNPSHCYSTSGIFSVSVVVTDGNGCTNVSAQNNYITVYPNPVALFNALPQPATLLTSTIQFNNLSTNSSQWQWSFGDVAGSSSALQHPNFTYSDTGTYQVQLIAISIDGCVDTVEQTVIVKPDFALYVPNSFTPNGDGINDLFIPFGMGIEKEEFEFFIFDRWGNLIFRSNSITAGWDGKANGGKNTAQIDTYVWKINLKDALGGKHQYAGKVSLLK